MINLAVTLKDYTASLSDFYSSMDQESILSIFRHGFLFWIQSILVWISYVISFSWLTDFMELPATIKHHTMVVLEGHNIVESDFGLNAIYAPLLGDSGLNRKGLLLGILNSFFLALPVSVPHLMSLRALFVNGPVAATGYVLGAVVGQAAFFVLVFSGAEWFFVPWCRFESITLVIGCVILGKAVFNIIHKNDSSWLELRNASGTKEKGSIRPSSIIRLRRYFWTNFRLVWFEQTCIFHYFGGLTAGGTGSILQTSNNSGFMYFFNTFLYWVGLNIGQLVFLILFGWVAWIIRTWICDLFKMTYTSWKRNVHQYGSILILAFSFHSLPYYGIDYITTKTLGFMDQDKTFEWFLHPQYRFKQDDPTYDPHMWHDMDPVLADTNGLVKLEDYGMTDYECIFDPAVMNQSYSVGNNQSNLAQEEGESFMAEQNWLTRDSTRFKYIVMEDTGAPKTNDETFEFNQRFKHIIPMRTDLRKFIKEPGYQTRELEAPYDRYHFRVELNTDGMEPENFPVLEEFIVWFDEDPIDAPLDALSGRVFRDDVLHHYEDERDFFAEWEMAHRDFRELFNRNKFYKALMQVNSLANLDNQFNSTNLNVTDEYDLYQRRYILQHYLDFASDLNQDADADHTSFANRVYNQQFKGTVNILGQYSAANVGFPDAYFPDNEFYQETIDFSEMGFAKKELANKKIEQPVRKPLSYDQPLFNRFHDEHLDWLHEELFEDIPKSWWPAITDDGQGKNKPEMRKYLKNNLRSNLEHDQKASSLSRTWREKEMEHNYETALSFEAPGLTGQLRDMVLSDGGPFYLGWNGPHGKMIVRSSRLPTGMEMTEWAEQASEDKTPDTWAFQAWPRETPDFLDVIKSPFLHNTQQKDFINLREAFRPLLSFQDKYINFKFESDLRTSDQLRAGGDRVNWSNKARKFANAMYAYPENESSKLNTDIVDEPYYVPRFTKNLTSDVNKQTQFQRQRAKYRNWERHIYDRFPNFVWYWRIHEAMEEQIDELDPDWPLARYNFSVRNYFMHIGQPIPPRLDGIAWPSISKPNLDKTNLPFSPYLRWKYATGDQCISQPNWHSHGYIFDKNSERYNEEQEFNSDVVDVKAMEEKDTFNDLRIRGKDLEKYSGRKRIKPTSYPHDDED